MTKASVKKFASIGKSEEATGKTLIEAIEERQTAELVLGFCGPLGSGTSAVAGEVSKILEGYGYDVATIKISRLIWKFRHKIMTELNEAFKLIDLDAPPEKMNEADRIVVHQFAGNLLRKKQNNDVLAQLAIREISVQRHPRKELQSSPENLEVKTPETRRFATILDSLKNPDEVKLLRAVYGNMFYLFGVLCPEDLRKNRLIQKKNIEAAKAIEMMERDKSEDERYGQQLLKTVFHSDFFVRNTKENVNSFLPNLKRFVDIILGKALITPTKEESAMYYAQSAAVRSACLSRQVGAAIINDDGELISTGCNDVPRFGGGLYSVENGDNDNRCMNLYGKVCQSDEFKKNLFKDIDEIICSEITEKNTIEKISKKIANHERLKGLIEFCRAIHAEMDAITSAARKGSQALRGASLFCTTFPCHHCARHIIAAGIKAVYYIEPYEKSLALRFHQDAIEFDPDSGSSKDKVLFIPFEGVAPRCYLNLFKARERKIDGKMVEIDLGTALPVIAQLMDRYIDFETKVVKNLETIGFGEGEGTETPS